MLELWSGPGSNLHSAVLVGMAGEKTISDTGHTGTDSKVPTTGLPPSISWASYMEQMQVEPQDGKCFSNNVYEKIGLEVGFIGRERQGLESE